MLNILNSCNDEGNNPVCFEEQKNIEGEQKNQENATECTTIPKENNNPEESSSDLTSSKDAQPPQKISEPGSSAPDGESHAPNLSVANTNEVPQNNDADMPKEDSSTDPIDQSSDSDSQDISFVIIEEESGDALVINQVSQVKQGKTDSDDAENEEESKVSKEDEKDDKSHNDRNAGCTESYTGFENFGEGQKEDCNNGENSFNKGGVEETRSIDESEVLDFSSGGKLLQDNQLKRKY